MPRKKSKDEAADELTLEFYFTCTRKVCKANRQALHYEEAYCRHIIGA